MKLGKISKNGMDNLMDVVREIKVSPEKIIMYLLENPDVSLKEVKYHDITDRKQEEFHY